MIWFAFDLGQVAIRAHTTVGFPFRLKEGLDLKEEVHSIYNFLLLRWVKIKALPIAIILATKSKMHHFRSLYGRYLQFSILLFPSWGGHPHLSEANGRKQLKAEAC